MLYAINDQGQPIRPQAHKEEATDPYSGGKVHGIFGEGLNYWRLIEDEYDAWALPDSRWNLEWKLKFPKQLVEISIQKDKQRHVADVRTNTGTVLKFQGRNLNEDQIRQREQFFEQMVWIFRADKWDIELNFHPSRYRTTEGRDRQLPKSDTFEWVKFTARYPKSVFKVCKMPVFLDFGDDSIYWLNWQSKSNLNAAYHPNTGLLKAYPKQQFIKKYSQLQLEVPRK